MLCVGISWTVLLWSFLSIASEKWDLFIVDLTQVCSCLIVFHCSLKANQLSDTGAIALARALQINKSLKQLK